VACEHVQAALPKHLLPIASSFTVSGVLEADIRVDVDLENINGAVIDGGVDLSKCRFEGTPDRITQKLAGVAFDHSVDVVAGVKRTLRISEDNPDYASLSGVPVHVRRAFIVAEDPWFYQHAGVDLSGLRKALQRNVRRQSFAAGGSTITMQLARNLFLDRDKNLARKLEEITLAHYIETRLSKDQILELYLNIIEFGPDLFGLGAASRFYFGKRPHELSDLQAVFLACLLPAPRRRFLQFCDGELSADARSAMTSVLAGLAKAKTAKAADIDNEELGFARPETFSVSSCRALVPELIDAP
jgi:membrane carboxypeptidase/penicillin-binding protein PbpC